MKKITTEHKQDLPGDIIDMKVLLDIGRALNDVPHIQRALVRVTERLCAQTAVEKAIVLLVDGDANRLNLEAAGGLEDGEHTRLAFGLEEGLPARVVRSGKAVMRPMRAKTALPDILGAVTRLTPVKAERLMLCAPIAANRLIMGVLAVQLPSVHKDHHESLTQYFSIMASMVGQALRVAQYIEADKRSLVDENTHLKQELKERYNFGQIIGSSSRIRQVYDQIVQVARTNTTVLLRGESGTGKEMVAHAIHYNSTRADKPFVKVSCAALPDTLIESELFGYEQGAFTGANHRKKGRFEMANGGTLFLDEIGDLNPQTQVKLLRALQEREFERVGGTETIKVNVRLVAATNKDLEEAMSDGNFRSDLFYRLNVFTIFLPPLRERKPDILMLADHFLERYGREHGKNIKRISTPAIDMLTSYHWPGNVRELENVIERAVVVCDSDVIHGHDLPPTLQTAEWSGTVTQLSLDSAVGAFEKDMIQDALKTTRGNIVKAAKLLESTERIIGYKLKKYGIDPTRFKR